MCIHKQTADQYVSMGQTADEYVSVWQTADGYVSMWQTVDQCVYTNKWRMDMYPCDKRRIICHMDTYFTHVYIYIRYAHTHTHAHIHMYIYICFTHRRAGHDHTGGSFVACTGQIRMDCYARRQGTCKSAPYSAKRALDSAKIALCCAVRHVCTEIDRYAQRHGTWQRAVDSTKRALDSAKRALYWRVATCM